MQIYNRDNSLYGELTEYKVELFQIYMPSPWGLPSSGSDNYAKDLVSIPPTFQMPLQDTTLAGDIVNTNLEFDTQFYDSLQDQDLSDNMLYFKFTKWLAGETFDDLLEIDD